MHTDVTKLDDAGAARFILEAVALRSQEVHLVAPESDSLLTAREVADILRVPLSSLYSRRYRHRDSGPPAFRIGGALRFSERELWRWIAEQAEDGDGTTERAPYRGEGEPVKT